MGLGTEPRKVAQRCKYEAFFLIDGEAPTIGAVLRQPALANTLRRIALNGPEGFYSGAVADDIVETLRNAGGLHTLDDFRNHKTEITQAVRTSYRNHKICQCPPNGPTALDLPRAFRYDGLYRLESGVSPLAAAGLEKLGHVVARSEEPLGGGQAIWIDCNGGAFIGGSDPRKDGCALGY